ncbi:MAG: hypothetical protein KA314_26860 [Chloroflexi bacterium]|nr:hypothetical protein [Chloroflexota bacterium]MBP8059473.1 hypothetical protein [Chloroflexota bacterium]
MTHEHNKLRHRSWSFPLFLLGVILGWLVIGWWLWPVEWINVDPWQLSAEGQRAYLAAVAEGYALTGDVTVMQARLNGWDGEAVAQLLAFMIESTPDAAAQQTLNNLREALALPQVNVTFLDLILGQKMILVTISAAALLLGVAAVLALYPSWQQAQVARLEAQRLEAEEAEAATIRAEATNTARGNAVTGTEEAEATDADATTETTQTDAPPTTPSEESAGGTAAASSPAAQANKNKPQGTPEIQATTQVTAQPLVGARPTGQLTPEDQTNVEKLLEDATGSIQELLTSVFDDEEKTAHFDTLLKGMGDVDMNTLLRLTERVRDQLRQQAN